MPVLKAQKINQATNPIASVGRTWRLDVNLQCGQFRLDPLERPFKLRPYSRPACRVRSARSRLRLWGFERRATR